MIPLILTYDLTKHNTPLNLLVEFDFYATSSGTCDIDWGDGVIQTNLPTGILSHTYSTAVTETITISNVTQPSTISTQSCTGVECLVACTQFEDVNFTSVRFADAINLTSVPSVLPASLTDLTAMFNGCTLFNDSNVSSWDTSNVTNLYATFSWATSFNQDISSWNVSNVTDMRYTFYNAHSFNQNIGGWDTSSVTIMSYMFTSALVFDQDISLWDVSNVTSMYYMFANAKTIQRSYYDAMLTNWGQLPVKLGVQFHAGDAQYTCGSTAETYRNSVLNNPAPKGWIITDGGCVNDMSEYYANISNDAPNGDGTQLNPFNRDDLNLYLENNVVSGDIFHVKGHLELSNTERLVFPDAFRNAVLTGPTFDVTFLGWDVENLGCPIIKWTYDLDEPQYPCNKNTWWDWQLAIDPMTVIFKDFILDSTDYFVAYSGSSNTNTYTYKDVAFIAPIFYASPSDGAPTSLRYPPTTLNLYGCTINAPILDITYLNTVGIYDSVLTVDSATVAHLEALVTYNTVTTINNFSDASIMYDITDISGYVPVLTKDITPTPTFSSFYDFVLYYTDPKLMYYKSYGVEDSSNPTLIAYRTTNGYNNGLFNDNRLSYGAYSFYTDPIILDTFPTSGHIGSFYFGGEFTNGVTPDNTLTLTMLPNDINKVEVNSSTIIRDKCRINVVIPNDKIYAQAQRKFIVDFVAKKRRDSEYPKFCQCVDNECSDTDELTYNSSIAGGNPLIVDFSACAKSEGEYSMYTPIAYEWYFDYANYGLPTSAKDSYLSGTSPYATYTYCGGYLENYDVRLCVTFGITT